MGRAFSAAGYGSAALPGNFPEPLPIMKWGSRGGSRSGGRGKSLLLCLPSAKTALRPDRFGRALVGPGRAIRRRNRGAANALGNFSSMVNPGKKNLGNPHWRVS